MLSIPAPRKCHVNTLMLIFKLMISQVLDIYGDLTKFYFIWRIQSPIIIVFCINLANFVFSENYGYSLKFQDQNIVVK